MSDMLDRLRAMANQAGTEAAADLGSADSISVMDARVKRGRRHRRRVMGTVATVAVAVVGAGAVVIPDLLPEPDPILVGPADRQVLHTDGPLTVYDDGSMSLVLADGSILPIPVSEDEPRQVIQRTKSEMCNLAVLDDVQIGWSYEDASYRDRLLGFGNVHYAAVEGYGPSLRSGTDLTDADTEWYGMTFVFDANPAVAPYLTTQLSALNVWRDGNVALSYGFVLDPAPQFELEGEGAYQVAVVKMRDLAGGDGWCLEGGLPEGLVEGARVDTYIFADIWINDGAGNATSLATHVSKVHYSWPVDKP